MHGKASKAVGEALVFNQKAETLYEQIGGDPTFRRLVDAFYARIEKDPLLRPIFPADLSEGKENQFLFLAQYWGGPARYEAQRGHPRLRMRHAPFAIGPAERDAWFANMIAAIDEVGIPEPARTQLVEYFDRAATFMINR
jgi:hemoglobin